MQLSCALLCVRPGTATTSVEAAALALKNAGAKQVQIFGAAPEDTDFSMRHDLAVVLGGDGSVLALAAKLQHFETPVLPLSAGDLGFLSEIPAPELGRAIARWLGGECNPDPRTMLRVGLVRQGKEIFAGHALNEAVITQNSVARMASIRASINGEFLTEYRADGLIAATPTGSTAYALSAGGPIVYPRFQGMLLLPVAAHSFSHRPLLLPAGKNISLQLGQKNADRLLLTLDGQRTHEVLPTDQVEICVAPETFNFIRLPEEHFFKTLRRVLGWGNAGGQQE